MSEIPEKSEKQVPGDKSRFVYLSDIGQIDDPTEFMRGVLSERGVRSLELIADALQTLARVESERLSREYPPEGRPKRATEINRTSDEKREQFSDRPSDKWVAETEAALPKSRFQQRLDQEAGSAQAVPKK